MGESWREKKASGGWEGSAERAGVCEERLAWLAVHFRRAGARVSHGGSALAHGRRVGNSSSTWHATEWLRWEAILGFFRAEFEDGPKTKFAHLGLLSNFN